MRVVNLQVGPSLAAMTDAAVLQLFNGLLEARDKHAASLDPTLAEIPPGHPQIEYSERSDQWVPRGAPWPVRRRYRHDGSSGVPRCKEIAPPA